MINDSQKTALAEKLGDKEVVRLVMKLIDGVAGGMAVERMFLFGSRATGKASKTSDLDILIIVPGSDEPGYRLAQKAYRSAGSVGISKDLVVMTWAEFEAQSKVVSSLAYRIKKEGILIYDRGEAARDLEMAGEKPA